MGGPPRPCSDVLPVYLDRLAKIQMPACIPHSMRLRNFFSNLFNQTLI